MDGLQDIIDDRKGVATSNLPDLLERSGLEHRCLFNGSAYDDLRNVAPWIVRLEERSAFTRHLFRCELEPLGQGAKDLCALSRNAGRHVAALQK